MVGRSWRGLSRSGGLAGGDPDLGRLCRAKARPRVTASGLGFIMWRCKAEYFMVYPVYICSSLQSLRQSVASSVLFRVL
jgi:hypothetical protein